MVMDYFEGQDLDTLVQQRGALAWMAQIVDYFQVESTR